jgi:hypothetical protein
MPAMSPKEIEHLRLSQIPEPVFDVVNSLLAKTGATSNKVIYQDDVVDALEARGFPRQDLFQNNWLDFEKFYEVNGWGVTYDKPSYNESYRAHWVFRIK